MTPGVIRFSSILHKFTILGSLSGHKNELAKYGGIVRFMGSLSLIAIVCSQPQALLPLLNVWRLTRCREKTKSSLRPEKPQIDVPVTIAQVVGIRLREIGVNRLDKLSKYAPGLNVQEQGGNTPGIVIPGLTSGSGSARQGERISVFCMLMKLPTQLGSGALKTLRLLDLCDTLTLHSFYRIS